MSRFVPDYLEDRLIESSNPRLAYFPVRDEATIYQDAAFEMTVDMAIG
jgi:hypothetical protein